MAVIPPEPNKTTKPRSISTSELLSAAGREFIVIIGKDGAGKTSAIVSLAAFIQMIQPEATFFVIDTENKFPTALRAYGEGVPTNISYFKCDNMNEANEAADEIMALRKEGDWLAVESMSRVWEKAQDLGYMKISGFNKETYLEKRRMQKFAGLAQAAVIPNADQFWNIVKTHHDAGFLEMFAQAATLNVVLSTTISKPPKPGAFLKENDTRKDVRAEFGLDLGIDGAPRLPYYAETMCLLDVQGGKVTCRIIRDSVNKAMDTRVSFDVPDRKAFGMAFWTNCRG